MSDVHALLFKVQSSKFKVQSLLAHFLFMPSRLRGESSVMQSHEVLREVFQKCSAKQIAADLDLSLSLVYKWSEPPTPDGQPTGNPLERVAALYRCSHDERILQWLCHQAGGFYIKNPKTHHAHPDYCIPA